MSPTTERIRVLYSFPHRIGHERICHIAWQQVYGLAAAGAEVILFTGSVHKALPAGLRIRVRSTLAKGGLRLPYRILGGMRMFDLHDRIVARRIEQLAGKIDIIHTWPLGALESLKTASRLGIPTVLERPNAHTRFAYEVVQKECERLGVALPPDHEHAYKEDVLCKEEEEYRLAYRLLCPSAFVARSFLKEGFAQDKLARHMYGYDEHVFHPDGEQHTHRQGLTVLFAGACAVRKGLHFALEAWLQSPAHRTGTFLIAGEFLPDYAKKLAPMLAHPSVHVLGHRKDIPELMRKSDVLVLPSIEEGSPLVCSEALGSGCVPLVTLACPDACRHMENALVHQVGDVVALTEHITMLHEDRSLLERLRANALRTARECTWTAAGEKLLHVYRDVLATAA